MDTKVVIVGDSGAGKTTFVRKLLNGVFHQDPDSTIGASVQTYSINERRFIFWDTAGQERFRSLVPMYYTRSHCVLLFYDMSDLDKHESIPGWLEDINSNIRDGTPIIIIGSKSDKETSVELNYDSPENKNAMNNSNIIAKIVISSKAETKKELLVKFSELFDVVHEYAKNHQGPRKGIVNITNQDQSTLEYFTGGYCNIL